MRKLILLTLALLASMAFTASAASAAVEVSDPATGEPCPELFFDGQALVEGGCQVEDFDGQWVLSVWTGSYFFTQDYDTSFDLSVGADGVGYATDIVISSSGLFRTACDDADSQQLPWPVEIRSVGNGEFEADIELCVRNAGSGPGGAPSHVPITVDVTSFGDDGATVLDQPAASGSLVQDAYWESPNTVDLDEVE